jgi:His/Glu/Gln/Arg/opine family amino acid ABC transporter permease subunit
MSFDLSMIAFGLPILLRGLVNTIIFCALSTVIGLMLATAIALARLSASRTLRWPALGFVTASRNTPFLIQAFLTYFGLAYLGLRLNASFAGVLVLTLFASANFSESLRGAILSVPKGQMEAARAVGMPYLGAMLRIVFPQALGYLIPSLTNQIIGLIKESAALSVITVPEVAMAGQMVLGESFGPIETYAMVAVLYWLLITAVATAMWQIARTRTKGRAQARQARVALDKPAILERVEL